MRFKNYNHTFIDLGRLGDQPNDPIIGGDINTWGEGYEFLSEINIFIPSDNQDNPSILIIGDNHIDLEGWDIDYDAIKGFISSSIETDLNDDEVDFILWHISGGEFGENYSSYNQGQAGEISLTELSGDPQGSLILSANVRMDSYSSWEAGSVEWLDEVDPDDELQIIAIYQQPV